MKRKNNLYNNLLKMENIEQAYNEVCSHTRNKRKVRNYKEYRCIYISRIYKILLERNYEVLSAKYEASQINYDVNKDGKVNSQDYVAIKNYIMQDKCYVDGGWNCE